MKMQTLVGISTVLAASLTVLPIPQAEAGFRAGHTSQGAATGRTTQGQYGSQGCARVGSYSASGASACGASFSAPNGTTGTSGRSSGYKSGVGGYTTGGKSVTGTNGSYSSARKGTYNAETGSGSYTNSKGGTYNGTSYGATTSATGTKGEGGTATVDTQNNGSYAVNCAPGTTCTKSSTP